MTAASKPCRLELNNSGSWKLLATFDASNEGDADALMNAAETLVQAINDTSSGRNPRTSLQIRTDEAYPVTLMRWTHERGIWVDARTGEPA